MAERYRRRRRIGLYLLVAFIVGGFLLIYVNVPERLRFYGFIFLIVAWFGVVVTQVFGVRLKCPACGKRLVPAKGQYCPQCGSDQFQPGIHRLGASRVSFCPSCGRIAEEDSESPRGYKIRGCTHCGVMLDERGV
jgi:hypothetical protein